MATIRETRKKLMPVVIVLALLILACVVYLFSPAGRSRQAREREYRAVAGGSGGQAAGGAAHARHGQQAEAGLGRYQRLLRQHAFPGTSTPPWRRSWARWRARHGVHLSAREVRREGCAHRGPAQAEHGDHALRRLPAGSEVHQRAGARQDVLPDRRQSRWASSRGTCACS